MGFKLTTLAEVWSLKNGNVFPPQPVFADGVMSSVGSDGFVQALK